MDTGRPDGKQAGNPFRTKPHPEEIDMLKRLILLLTVLALLCPCCLA